MKQPVQRHGTRTYQRTASEVRVLNGHTHTCTVPLPPWTDTQKHECMLEPKTCSYALQCCGKAFALLCQHSMRVGKGIHAWGNEGWGGEADASHALSTTLNRTKESAHAFQRMVCIVHVATQSTLA